MGEQWTLRGSAGNDQGKVSLFPQIPGEGSRREPRSRAPHPAVNLLSRWPTRPGEGLQGPRGATDLGKERKRGPSAEGGGHISTPGAWTRCCVNGVGSARGMHITGAREHSSTARSRGRRSGARCVPCDPPPPPPHSSQPHTVLPGACLSISLGRTPNGNARRARAEP